MSNTSVQTAAVAAATPSFIPAIVTVAGLDIPVMTFGLSVVGLLLARSIAPAARRKLTKAQEWCLSGLLCIILLLVVSGQLGGQMLKPGMGAVWGIGLGTSGLLVIEFFGDYVMGILRALFNKTEPLEPK